MVLYWLNYLYWDYVCNFKLVSGLRHLGQEYPHLRKVRRLFRPLFRVDLVRVYLSISDQMAAGVGGCVCGEVVKQLPEQ